MKKAALRLSELPLAERDFAIIQVWIEQQAAVQLPAIQVDDLRNAWVTILTRAKANRHHQIKRELRVYSVAKGFAKRPNSTLEKATILAFASCAEPVQGTRVGLISSHTTAAPAKLVACRGLL